MGGVPRLCGDIPPLASSLRVFLPKYPVSQMFLVLSTAGILNGLKWHGLRFRDE